VVKLKGFTLRQETKPAPRAYLQQLFL